MEALTGLDPAERALLDLSLRQQFSDSRLAELSGTDEPAIASWRKAVIEEVAEEAEIDTSAGPEQVERELRAAPASAWLSSASEPTAARSHTRRNVLGVALALIAAIVVVVLIAHGSSGTGSSTVASNPPTATPSGGIETRKPVALAPLAGGDTSAEATAELEGSDALFVKVSGLPDPGNGAYRLWLFNSVIDSKPVGALASGNGTIHATLPPDASRYRYLDLTRESSPTDDTYSGLVILRAPLREVAPG